MIALLLATATAVPAYIAPPDRVLVVTSTGAHSTSSTTPTAIPGATWTPGAGRSYVLEITVAHTSAAQTTGVTVTIDGGTSTGSCRLVARGDSASTDVVAYADLGAPPTVASGSAPASPGRALVIGECLITADASPTAFALKAGSEINESQITIPTGSAVLRIRQL